MSWLLFEVIRHTQIGEDDPEEEQLFRDLWEDETQREMVLEALKADCEVRTEGGLP